MLFFKLTPGLLALLLLSGSDAFTPTGLAAQRNRANPSSSLMVRHWTAFQLERRIGNLFDGRNVSCLMMVATMMYRLLS